MRITNLAQFNAGLDRFARLIPERALAFQKKVVFMLLGAYVQTAGGGIGAYAGVLHLTPVLSGRAVGNWQVALGSPDGSTIDTGFAGGGGARGAAIAGATGRAFRVLAGARPYGVISIFNNLAYIVVLNDGGLNRVAHHMVERAMANARAALRAG